jgi:tRNA(adenine34) deaminase
MMVNMLNKHNIYMLEALHEAELALAENEVPIGAVLVFQDQIVARDHNRTKQLASPLAHAEKLIIDKIMASKAVYLYEYTLYVTLEPCLMCAGMLIWSRIGTVVFGAGDPKAGVVGSIYNVFRDKSFNHHPEVISGIMESRCSELLSGFFKNKR